MNLAPGDYPFDIVVQIGTFQPWLHTHQLALGSALRQAPRVALVLAGATQAPSVRHPFSLEQRAELLRRSIPADWRPRVALYALRESYPPGPDWQAVLDALEPVGGGLTPRLAVQAEPGLPPAVRPGAVILAYPCADDAAATWRRSALMAGLPPAMALPGTAGDAATPDAAAWLAGWLEGTQRTRLREEWQALEQDRLAWSVAPYPVTKVTVDCVIECAGHVLLIQRGRAPGRDLHALPGGFIDTGETLLQSARRELAEETSLDLAHEEPRGSAVFDAPWRSQRGRVITHAYHFVLKAARPPALHAGDDAAQARWMPLGRLPALAGRMHDDHALILAHFLDPLREDPLIRLSW
ncbi:MAG: NUDIX domain-containing protein [Pigmentiphaga sp.]